MTGALLGFLLGASFSAVVVGGLFLGSWIYDTFIDDSKGK